MKQNFIIITIVMFLAFTMSFTFLANAGGKNKEKSSQTLVVYKPPMRGAPGNRMGGGTRGLTNEPISLTVLVPNHTGLTTQQSPVLYWYVSSPVSKHVMFTLNEEENQKTFFKTDLGSITREGIQRLNLTDYNLKLLPDKEYSWFITVIANPDQPANDIFSGGYIRYTTPSKILSKKLAKADKIEIPLIYAQEGIWYDALASLSQLIETEPDNNHLHQQRASLFEQAELYDAADFERGR